MNKDRDVILVSGATGQQGGAIARRLLSSGYRVRAMTRKPQEAKAQALATAGAQVVAADLDDAESLERALAGAWGAFAVQNTWEAGVEREEEQGKRFAEVAKKSGVSHLVYNSVASADRNTGIPHFDNKFRIEQKTRMVRPRRLRRGHRGPQEDLRLSPYNPRRLGLATELEAARLGQKPRT